MPRVTLTLSMILLAVVVAVVAQQKSRRPSPSFKKKAAGLELPNNATAIREDIVDTFSCEKRIYGYYADIENECQIFHICLPQTRNSIRFSFICPAETVFNQATFVCTLEESSIPCEESEKYYSLNEQFGQVDGDSEESVTDSQGNEVESTTDPTNPSQRPSRPTASPSPATQLPQRPKPTKSKKPKQ